MIFGLLLITLWCFTAWLPKKMASGKCSPAYLGMVFLLNLLATSFIGFWMAGVLAAAAGVSNSAAPAVVGAMQGFLLAMTVGGWSLFRARKRTAHLPA